MFKEPIEVQPNTNYTASATLKVRIVWKIIYIVENDFSHILFYNFRVWIHIMVPKE